MNIKKSNGYETKQSVDEEPLNMERCNSKKASLAKSFIMHNTVDNSSVPISGKIEISMSHFLYKPQKQSKRSLPLLIYLCECLYPSV